MNAQDPEKYILSFYKRFKFFMSFFDNTIMLKPRVRLVVCFVNEVLLFFIMTFWRTQENIKYLGKNSFAHDKN